MSTKLFADNVNVYSETKFLRRVPPGEARRLLAGGGALGDMRGGKVCSILVHDQIGRPIRSASMPSLSQYMGQRYTRREAVKGPDGQVAAHCIAFREIHEADQELFLLAITDCGGALQRKQLPNVRGSFPELFPKRVK